MAVVDYGCKRSILRRLAKTGAGVTVVPATTGADELAGYDGVVLSNGPGDPEPLTAQVETVRSLLGRVPSSASVSATSCSRSRRATRPSSSRSGTAAPITRFWRRRPDGSRHRAEPRLRGQAGKGREATHVSLYDGTVEGLDYPEVAARSVQFHPEAGPGPHDAWPLLETWVEEVRAGLAKAA